MEGVKVKYRLKVLTDDKVDDIHEATLKILEKTGVRFDSEDSRKRLIKAGAAKHPTRKDVILFPRGLVEDSIKSGHAQEERGLNPSRNAIQTVTLLTAIAEMKLDACLGGAGRDEEKARAKERIFSHRDEFGQ